MIISKSMRFVSAAFVLLFMATAAQAQGEIRYKELPNFHRVNAVLYRGGQPAAGGFKRLASLGIRTIINLRDSDDRALLEEKEARAAGLRYFNVAFDGIGRPNDVKVERVLDIIDAVENQPVFVHCRRGSERTGTVIACYRISHDGWTSEQTKAEAKRYGMGFWVIRMKDYIRDYYRRWSEQQAKVTAKPG
jgi:tyrosine-protein phosphatase SIW14